VIGRGVLQAQDGAFAGGQGVAEEG